MSNYSPRSHFEFGRTALFSSQQVLLLSEILFVHLLACWPSCPILTRVKAAEFRASSVLLCVGITSSWTAKGIPHDLFSAWAVGYVSRAWGTKVWNCKFCQRWREMSWLAKIAVLWELISVLYFTRPSLLSQHPYACWDCWVTSLSLPSTTWEQEPVPVTCVSQVLNTVTNRWMGESMSAWMVLLAQAPGNILPLGVSRFRMESVLTDCWVSSLAHLQKYLGRSCLAN